MFWPQLILRVVERCAIEPARTRHAIEVLNDIAVACRAASVAESPDSLPEFGRLRYAPFV